MKPIFPSDPLKQFSYLDKQLSKFSILNRNSFFPDSSGKILMDFKAHNCRWTEMAKKLAGVGISQLLSENIGDSVISSSITKALEYGSSLAKTVIDSQETALSLISQMDISDFSTWRTLSSSSSENALKALQQSFNSSPALELAKALAVAPPSDASTLFYELSLIASPASDLIKSIKNGDVEFLADDPYTSTFLGSRILQTSKVIIDESSDEICIRIEELEKDFIDHIKKLPHSKLAFAGQFITVLSMFLNILFWLMPAKSENSIRAGISEVKQLNIKILHSQERVLDRVYDLYDPFDNSNTYYFVDRTTSLYSKPTTKSNKVSLLTPTQKVLILQRKGKWILIEYYNYIDGVAKSGWALKKYLKRI